VDPVSTDEELVVHQVLIFKKDHERVKQQDFKAYQEFVKKAETGLSLKYHVVFSSDLMMKML